MKDAISKISQSVFIVFIAFSMNECFKDGLMQEVKAQDQRMAGSRSTYTKDGSRVPGRALIPKSFNRKPIKISGLQGGGVHVLYNCTKDLKITTLNPGESVHIQHLKKNLWIENRCSYDFVGSGAGVDGPRDSIGRSHVWLKQYKKYAPFPSIPPYAVVFYLADPNKPLDYARIRKQKKMFGFIRPDGKITFNNRLRIPLDVHVVYNHMSMITQPDKGGPSQIGYDGSTVEFIVKKTVISGKNS